VYGKGSFGRRPGTRVSLDDIVAAPARENHRAFARINRDADAGSEADLLAVDVAETTDLSIGGQVGLHPHMELR